jgi:hypothetical protein
MGGHQVHRELNRLSHPVDSPHGHAIKPLTQLFGSSRKNRRLEFKNPHRLTQKRRLLRLRLGQGNGNLRPAERNRDPRQSRA